MTNHIECAVGFLLDESGSMGSIKDSMKTAMMEFINELKTSGINGIIMYSLYTFNSCNNTNKNNTITTRINFQNLDTIEDFMFEPSGMTALHDAQVVSIKHFEDCLNKLDTPPEKIIFVTLTDGQENDSIYYTHTDVAKLVSQKTNEKQWKFVYLGANQNSICTSNSMGIGYQSTLDYNATDEGIGTAMKSASRAISAYCTQESTNVEFTQQDRESNK